jgi:hypothetical protein
MAYFRDIQRRCVAAACKRLAIQQLIGNRNEELGCYCDLHGESALMERQRLEAEWTKREQEARSQK